MKGVLFAVAIFLSFGVAQLAAQQTAPVAMSDSVVLGSARGAEAARHESTTNWVAGGFAGGMTLGPIGAGLSWVLANNSDATVALPQKMMLISQSGPEYMHAFEDSYASTLRSRRKRSALFGGAIVTAALAAVITTVWAVYYYY
ncbi:hypothetical protein BH23GEM3_BH23GEM3_25700 [soil metagenome]